MRNILLILFVLTAIAIFPSCKKNSVPTPKPPAPPLVGPFLYIGGTDGANGIYYKISLANPAAAVQDTIQGLKNINSIITRDSDLYFTGGAGGYWKNDSFIAVTEATSIYYLALSGSSIFSAGYDNSSNLAYWSGNNGTNIANSLPQEAISLSVNGIAVADSNANTSVYISGNAVFAFAPGSGDTLAGDYGTIWENGKWQLFGADLPPGPEITTGIVLSGADVYVAGLGPADSTTYGGGYWKNGIWNVINKSFIPACIAGSGSNIYIGGSIQSPPAYQAVYWENGNLINLPGGTNASAIAFYGSDVYILGVTSSDTYVVWKNGTLFTTLDPNVAFGPYCLAVGN
jgi:hypothetical protein